MNRYIFQYLILILLISGCKAYKQDIMFQLNEDFEESDLAKTVDQAERNYKLQPDDLLQLNVFTNKGERLIDPNSELDGQSSMQNAQYKDQFQYLLQNDGSIKLPLLEKKNLQGLTIDEAESILEQAYNTLYVDSFVKIRILNRRVTVLGAQGGQVIPIENENTTLVEILALYGGVNVGSKATNVRVIRGSLSNPEVFFVDLSTIDGMKNTIIDVEAGDIIYVEPWRRPWLETVRDVSPVFGFITSVTTLVIVILSL